MHDFSLNCSNAWMMTPLAFISSSNQIHFINGKQKQERVYLACIYNVNDFVHITMLCSEFCWSDINIKDEQDLYLWHTFTEYRWHVIVHYHQHASHLSTEDQPSIHLCLITFLVGLRFVNFTSWVSHITPYIAFIYIALCTYCLHPLFTLILTHCILQVWDALRIHNYQGFYPRHMELGISICTPHQQWHFFVWSVATVTQVTHYS